MAEALAYDQETVNAANLIFRPQPGKQTDFLSTEADICIYGGAAGSGKTMALLLDPLRHIGNKDARVITFRRQSTQITNQGGLWDESFKIYPHLGATSNAQHLRWKFPSGAQIGYAHLQHVKDIYNHQGAQYTQINFDELTHFDPEQFWYMLSRLRSMAGVKGYIRCTCNPDADSWVADLIEWYLMPSGLADPEKAGKIRYFFRENNSVFWADSPSELKLKHQANPEDIKSFTFIPATIEDNQILLQNDQAYLSNLRALDEIEKQRLLFGNWKVKKVGGVFKLEWFKNFMILPSNLDCSIITCDTADKTKEQNDYTVYQYWGMKDGNAYLIDQVRGKFEYAEKRQLLLSFSNKYKPRTVYIEDKVSGTSLIQELQREMRGSVSVKPISRSVYAYNEKRGKMQVKDKLMRAQEAVHYIEAGRVFLNPGADYYPEFTQEVQNFSRDMSHRHDDQIDPMCDAIDKLFINPDGLATQSNRPRLSQKIC
jgi:predicted phage terminase large subunit-like protein